MRNFLAISILFFSIVSCDEDEANDTTAPQISDVEINGLHEEVVVNAGDNINVSATLSDDEEVSQLKLEVHDIFDGHSHKSTKWEINKVYDFSSANVSFSEDLTIPMATTAGPYHAVLRVLDASGNESDFEEVDFMILNGTEPQFNITAPDLDHIHVNPGDVIVMEGTITDNVDIQEIIIVVEEEGDHHDHKGVQDEALYEMDFDLPGSSDTSWDFQADGNVNIQIPIDAEAGDYALEIVVEDNEGNLAIIEGHVHIEE